MSQNNDQIFIKCQIFVRQFYNSKTSYRHYQYHYYQCYCFEGFSGDGFNCLPDTPVYVDECSAGTHHCSHNAHCHTSYHLGKGKKNKHGLPYDCECIDGYTGNGFTCEPVFLDPCASGSHACDREAFCVYDGYYPKLSFIYG